ncbi:MAG: Hsp20/alpha crystallin family protein [DPANN group archaeon]|nr:Hsp20/alpha crystallin family protein [DPANN group archaeon]
MFPNTLWDEIRRMQEDMDGLFRSFFSSPAEGRPLLEDWSAMRLDNKSRALRRAYADIWETDDEVKAEIELPGMDKKNIRVNVSSDGIEVKAETKEERKDEDKKKGLYRLERSYSGFYRRFPLPEGADPEHARAEYKDGVLRIAVPKKAIPHKKRKLLEIK